MSWKECNMSITFLKKISFMFFIFIASSAYAGANFKVTLGVTPGCQSGATMTTVVWAEGSFAACDIAKNKTFEYCCGAVQQ